MSGKMKHLLGGMLYFSCNLLLFYMSQKIAVQGIVVFLNLFVLTYVAFDNGKKQNLTELLFYNLICFSTITAMYYLEAFTFMESVGTCILTVVLILMPQFVAIYWGYKFRYRAKKDMFDKS